jgi:hypothetical protein
MSDNPFFEGIEEFTREAYRPAEQRLRWYLEDDEWFAWTENQSMRTDEPKFIVRMPARDVWAGFQRLTDGSQTCVTHDHYDAHDAKDEVNRIAER